MANFITNSNDSITIKERLQNLIKASKELKFLVGFFYFSGWQEIYKSLKANENVKLKILVGLNVDKIFSNIFEIGINDYNKSYEEYFTDFIKSLSNAINNPDMDNREFYEQVEFFKELLENDRLIIRKTLNPNHAKLYLFELTEENQKILNKKGLFITGSSNFTKAGFSSQEEFNVEISDYGFEEAEDYFNELWEKSVPITEAPNGKSIIIDFLENKSQTAIITPFEAYAYILKTYIDLQETKKISTFIERILEENGFEKFTYQLDAVNQALNIIETYNGVIIADVVGLGKSVIASLIANQLGKRGLILCPPGLIGDKKEGTGWYEYWNKFKLYNWDIESTGNIEKLAESLEKQEMGYEVIIVDEAHRFRNQDTASYKALSDICKGKIVILLTATPFSNTPNDIFSLLKLFIVPGKSGLTIEPDLEGRFHSYNYRFRNLSFILKNYNSPNIEKRKKAEQLYKQIFEKNPPIDINLVRKTVAQMSKEIKNVIEPIIIRRNRLDLIKDFEYRKEIKNISKVNDPIELFYELTKEQSEFYDKIIRDYFGENGEFKGAIYRPFEYEEDYHSIIEEEKYEEFNRIYQQQRNLFDFMRRLLVKRFESSFGAFAESINRFLKTHKMVKSFIDTSKKYILDRKIIESIYNENENADDFALEAIEKALIEFKEKVKGKVSPKHEKIYEIEKFKRKEDFLRDLENDIKLFEKIKEEIEKLQLVENDPKRATVIKKIKNILKEKNKPKRKVVLFTEYVDTVKHLKEYFEKELNNRVLFCEGVLSKTLALKIEENFNAKFHSPKDDYDVLVASDKLSEGVNLNRAGAIINYDIPWNPTRVIQRVGRINRIGTKVFDELFIYNFFPTEKGAKEVKVREIAQQKMFLIHNALGEDAKIFDLDEEPTPSGLFKKLNTFPEEEEELSLITIVRNEFAKIKKEYPQVIDKIKQLPNRTKTAKIFKDDNVVVLRKKGLALFALMGEIIDKKIKIKEITFENLLEFVKCNFTEKRIKLSIDFWELYDKIKDYKPKYKLGRSDVVLDQKAINSLKSLINKYKEELSPELISFINTLLKDLKQYKTLPKFTIRKLVLSKDNNYKELIKNIEELRRKWGDDYLDNLIEKTKFIDDEIIITVENMGNENLLM